MFLYLYHISAGQKIRTILIGFTQTYLQAANNSMKMINTYQK